MHDTAKNIKTDDANQMLTVRQAAALLVVHPETIRRRIRDGSVAAIKVGSAIRVRAADLMRGLAVGKAA